MPKFTLFVAIFSEVEISHYNTDKARTHAFNFNYIVVNKIKKAVIMETYAVIDFV